MKRLSYLLQTVIACHADKNPYRHDRRADKNPYRNDGRADKNSYRHDRRADSQCRLLRRMKFPCWGGGGGGFISIFY